MSRQWKDPWEGWHQRSELVEDVRFDFEFVVSGEFVIVSEQIHIIKLPLINMPVGARSNLPFKGYPLHEPQIPRSMGPLPVTRDLMGCEEEMIRYYRSVLDFCRSRGIDCKTDRDARRCFGVIPEIFADEHRISMPVKLLMSQADGDLMYEEDQTGRDILRGIGNYFYVHEVNDRRESINVKFQRKPLQDQVTEAAQRLQTLLDRFRAEFGDDYWERANRWIPADDSK